MKDNTSKDDFIRLLMEAGALQFGEFTLRSGRVSPYFFNVARFRTGSQLTRLGEFMAAKVKAAAPEATIVFGPAYKGIPLCLSTAMALGRDGGGMGYLFDRKEVKAHGDKGRFVGQFPTSGDRLVLVDDVITDGETKREAVAMLLEAFDVPIDALVIAFNRMERDSHGGDALHTFEAESGVPVHALLSLAELQEALAGGLSGILDDSAEADGKSLLARIRAYREEFGTES